MPDRKSDQPDAPRDAERAPERNVQTFETGTQGEPDRGDGIVHVQVNEGARVIHEGRAYGHRSTLQVRRRDLDSVTRQGAREVDPNDVPEVGQRLDVGEARRA